MLFRSEAANAFGASKTIQTGIPVRAEFFAIPTRPHTAPLTVLVFGGSQGARSLNRAVVAYIIVVIVNYLASRLQYVQLNAAGEGFLRILRTRVFAHIQRQSMAFFDRNKAGVLVARMTADIESMGELIQWGLLQFVGAGLLLAMSLVLMAALSWQLTLLVVVCIAPILAVASVRFQRQSNAAYLEVRERVGQNLSNLQEGITGVRVIQAYGREAEQERRFVESNRTLYRSHKIGRAHV